MKAEDRRHSEVRLSQSWARSELLTTAGAETSLPKLFLSSKTTIIIIKKKKLMRYKFLWNVSAIF